MSLVVVIGATAIFPTVTLSSCYHFLSTRLVLGMKGAAGFPAVVRETVLLALLISLLFQLWFAPYGWNWFPNPKLAGVAGCYAAAMLLGAFLLVVNGVFRSTLDTAAGTRRKLLLAQIGGSHRSSLVTTGSLLVVGVGVWQLLSMADAVSLILSSPVETIKGAYRLLIVGSMLRNVQSTLWSDMYVSLVEITGGLILGGGMALVVSEALSVSPVFRKLMQRLLPLAYAAPVVLVPWWSCGYSGSLCSTKS